MGIFVLSPFKFMDICVLTLNPAHESETRGYLFHVMIIKKILIPLILFKFSHSILDWTALSCNLEGGGGETFLEGSVDRVFYRDYTVDRRFFIYGSLATEQFYVCFSRVRLWGFGLRLLLTGCVTTLRSSLPF